MSTISINSSLRRTLAADLILLADEDETIFLRINHVTLLDVVPTVALYSSELCQFYQWAKNVFEKFKPFYKTGLGTKVPVFSFAEHFHAIQRLWFCEDRPLRYGESGELWKTGSSTPLL